MVFVSFLKMCTILVINMNEGHLRMFLLQVDIDPDCHRLLVKNAIDIESMKLRGEKVALIISSFAEVIWFSCFFSPATVFFAEVISFSCSFFFQQQRGHVLQFPQFKPCFARPACRYCIIPLRHMEFCAILICAIFICVISIFVIIASSHQHTWNLSAFVHCTYPHWQI